MHRRAIGDIRGSSSYLICALRWSMLWGCWPRVTRRRRFSGMYLFLDSEDVQSFLLYDHRSLAG